MCIEKYKISIDRLLNHLHEKIYCTFEQVVVKIRKEHIRKGIDKYKGVRQEEIEKLFAQGNLKAKVYRFEDGRMLVHYLLIDNALLYSDEQSLMDAIVLE